MKYFCTSCGFQQRGWNHPCSHCLVDKQIEARGPVQDILDPESGLLWKTRWFECQKQSIEPESGLPYKTLFERYKTQALEKERDMVAVMDQIAADCPAKESS